jgi:outer membrane protein W
MSRILYRVLFLLFILTGALRSSAQDYKSDVALWAVGSYVADSYIEGGSFDSLDVTFEEQHGFGVSFNHFWMEHLSTELALTTLRADVIHQTVVVEPPHKIGELDARTLTALGQWHFRQGTRVMPYLGAGVAHTSGIVDSTIQRPDNDLESGLTWAAAAGLNVRLTDRIALAFEAKKVGPGEVEEDDGVAPGIDVDPMLYGSGVRFRF